MELLVPFVIAAVGLVVVVIWLLGTKENPRPEMLKQGGVRQCTAVSSALSAAPAGSARHTGCVRQEFVGPCMLMFMLKYH